MVIRSNRAKSLTVFRITNSITGYIYEKANFITNYLSLREVNRQLLDENARIHNKNKNLYFEYEKTFIKKSDTLESFENDSVLTIQQYTYTPALVINNSTNKSHNFITLNVGSKHGIKADMGVVSGKGVAGIIKEVSPNFSRAISVLNITIYISAKIKINSIIGSIHWDGEDNQLVTLNDIPSHIPINVGDTIVTSGYSGIFPEGIVIGTISEYNKNTNDNFYDIKVKLETDFRTLNIVYVIGNIFREEQLKLENSEEND